MEFVANFEWLVSGAESPTQRTHVSVRQCCALRVVGLRNHLPQAPHCYTDASNVGHCDPNGRVHTKLDGLT